VSIQVSTFAMVLSAAMYPFTFALFGAMKVTTLYFFPAIVAEDSVTSFFAACRRNPYGVSQIGSWFGHGVFALTISCCMAPGCRPPPLRAGSGVSATRSIRIAGASRSNVRVSLFIFHPGQGELGLYACPKAYSIPEPESWIVFN